MTRLKAIRANKKDKNHRGYQVLLVFFGFDGYCLNLPTPRRPKSTTVTAFRVTGLAEFKTRKKPGKTQNFGLI